MQAGRETSRQAGRQAGREGGRKVSFILAHSSKGYSPLRWIALTGGMWSGLSHLPSANVMLISVACFAGSETSKRKSQEGVV